MGPSVVGFLRHCSESYTTGLLVMAAALVLEAILVLSLRLTPRAPEGGEPRALDLGPAPAK